MSTIFNNPSLFQIAYLTFFVHSVYSEEEYDPRGNIKKDVVQINIKVKIKPNSSDTVGEEQGQHTTETYSCRMLEPSIIIPKELKLGDIGESIINGNKCKVRIDKIQQSGVSPITTPILGEALDITVFYSTLQGNATNLS